MEKLIEAPTGRGMVSRADGAPVRDMRYALAVYRRFHDGGIPGEFRIAGHIEISAADRALVMDHAPLTLTLEDGRVLDFYFTDEGGQIANRSSRFLGSGQ
jgi:hypothetical protein